MKNTIPVTYSAIGLLMFAWLICPNSRVAGQFISPEDLAMNRLEWVIDRIEIYATENKHLPRALSDLPDSPDKDNGLTDGWRQPLVYTPEKNGLFTLETSGKDGSHTYRLLEFSLVDESNDTPNINLDLTFNALFNIQAKIRNYAQLKHQLPHSLSDLDILNDIIDGTAFDGWGDPIVYYPQPDNSVILRCVDKSGSNRHFSFHFSLPGLLKYVPTTNSTEPTDLHNN